MHGKHAPVGAARFACFCRRAEILGASGRRPLPVHAKRVCRLLLKHSQAAKPPFGRSLSGTFHLLLKKQDKTRGVGRRPLPVHAKRVQMHHASRVSVACFASIHRRQNRRLDVPAGNISMLLKKHRKNPLFTKQTTDSKNCTINPKSQNYFMALSFTVNWLFFLAPALTCSAPLATALSILLTASL